ncbi:MAG TPA: galactokinase family protein [Frankiaceae bacterium]|nr:galactokinase family protein [Frankiaceae bacterium]
MDETVRAFAPGRVNLIGDHTDYAGGLACPMAIDLGTSVVLRRGGDVVSLVSEGHPEPASVPLACADPASVTPSWARYVAGVVSVLRPPAGGVGTVSTTLPVGAGLSSSAALELSLALALGFSGTPMELAALCQRAEHAAVGLPSGLLDQMSSALGRAGHAMVVDFATLGVSYVPLPPDAEVVVVDSRQPRELAGSEYADRREDTVRAAAVIGPLGSATLDDVERLDDSLLRRRARHVVTENERVRSFAAALAAGDLPLAGRLMRESHASLAEDFDVSTPAIDRLVEKIGETEGVYGVRMTGGGFGGCLVALTAPGVLTTGWKVRAVDGAHLS